jgi:hypothetical protein
MNADLGRGTPTTAVPVITPSGNVTIGGLSGGVTTMLDGSRPQHGSTVITPGGNAYVMDSALGHGVPVPGGALKSTFGVTVPQGPVANPSSLNARPLIGPGTPVILSYIFEKNNGGSITYERVRRQTIPFIRIYDYWYTITIGDKTNRYHQRHVQRIGEHFIINSEFLIIDFGLSVEQATHQIHKDVFHNMDDAALAWALSFYQASADDDNYRGLEYASAMYRRGDGYAFGELSIADPSRRHAVVVPDAPSGYTRTGAVHTHIPVYGWRNESFSKFWPNTRVLVGDHYWAADNQLPLYMATPRGNLRKLLYTGFDSYEDILVFRGLR